MAFVLVAHTAASVDAFSAELLGRHTPLPVREAAPGDRIEPAHLLVLPPHLAAGVRDGVLEGGSPTSPVAAGGPVDRFFRALAEDQRSRAVGLVLPGIAHDGELGLRAIRLGGGTVFEISETAGPAAVDGAAGELVRFGQLRPPDPSGLKQILALVRKATDLDLSPYRPELVGRRIQRRMAVHRVCDADRYVQFLHRHPVEFEALCREILAPFSGFPDDPEHAELLRQSVFPELLANRPADMPLRAWVPGCATGEEAYSIAMSLLDSVEEAEARVPVTVFGTDLDPRAMAAARAGIYCGRVCAGVPADRLRRFFRKHDRGYQVRIAVRETCVFAKHNLIEHPPFRGLDVISCRNVLSSLEPASARGILANFHRALKPSGVLLLGESEDAAELCPNLFRALGGSRGVYGVLPAQPTPAAGAARSRQGTGNRETDRWSSAELRREVDRLLLGEYCPPGVVVDGDLEILEVRGDVSPYVDLARTAARLNLLRQARDGWAPHLKAAIRKARTTNGAVRKRGVRTDYAGARKTDLRVIPLKVASSLEHYLVLFEDRSPSNRLRRKPLEPGSAAREIAALREELFLTAECLRALLDEREAVAAESGPESWMGRGGIR
jgi:two-component system CheB/CheR fusion protein